MASNTKTSFIFRILFFALFSPTLITGCEHVDDLLYPAGAGGPTIGGQVEQGVDGLLMFLNTPTTTELVLDYDVRLDHRAARAIIEHRDGPDGQSETDDDNYFDTLGEVQSLSWVGDGALNRILEFAREDGWISEEDHLAGIFEGVSFSIEQEERTLELANTLNEHDLDRVVGLDHRAAKSIIDARPLKTLTELSNLDYVGPAALRTIRNFISQ